MAEQRDPFSWASEFSQTQSQRAAQEDARAQQSLMAVFQEEAARQRPWSNLPVDLALQNNQFNNSVGLANARAGADAYAKSFDVPKDALAFGANVAGRLAKDLGISVEAASGIVGNLSSETGGFKDLQELSPAVPGSRGGAGWAMWTGPRRVAFEKFTGGDTTSPEANYNYLVYDLKNNYPKVLADLQKATTPAQAAQIFHNRFLAPGIPHLSRSANTAQKIYETFNTTQNKQIVGDAEYDRRQARKGASEQKKGSFTYGGKQFDLGAVSDVPDDDDDDED